MDSMLEAFWRTWPWPPVVLAMLLLAGGTAYLWWLDRLNGLTRRTDLKSCDSAVSDGFEKTANKRCPTCGQLVMEENSFD